jgi:hypothetical protein
VRTRRGWPALGYAVLFVLAALPWLRASADAVPYGNPFAFADDARFWVWQLGWVAHAMATDPAHVLDANIHHPAPAQLTSSEHLASTQLVAVPAIWLTGNAVLVANLIVWLSYPLAALAMFRLLVALGCEALVAWTGGLLFALGPLRVPANLEVIHFLNVYLPLAALALHRLRDAPVARRAAALFVVLGAGTLSGYYLAAMLAVVAAVWTAFELARPVPRRGRFLAAAAIAAGTATAVLLVVSLPYFGRPELAIGRNVGGIRPVDTAHLTIGRVWTYVGLLFGPLPPILAVLGLGALAAGDQVARRLALAGLALVVVGLAVVFPSAPVAAAIAASPLGFLRAEFRFATVAGFGTSLLAAALLQTVSIRAGTRAGAVAALVVVALGLATLAVPLSGPRPDRIAAAGADRPVHDAVAGATRDDAGPLLVLPLVDARPAAHDDLLPLGQLESDDMVGSLVHRLPLVTGHTGYPPLHRDVLLGTIRLLPAPEALDDIVDLTHVRWLLLRPADYWSDAGVRERLLAVPGVARTLDRDGWTLARVERPVRRVGWYEAIAAGYRPDRTVLGTPLEALPEAEAVAVVETPRPVADTVAADGALPIDLQVQNAGTRGWPVVVPPTAPQALTVRLAARWTRLVGTAPAGPVELFRLRRDVPPGDTIAQGVVVRAPREPGDYALALAIEQDAGARFDARGNVPLRTRVRVTAR